jgi:HEPN domain-containing protein
MKPITAEWVAKAEGDYAIVRRESRVRKLPSLDGICFHAQQCAEKYLKAILAEAAIPFGKTHDLVALLEQVLSQWPASEAFRADLAYLTDFAVAFRYPGESADRRTARDAAGRCRKFRSAARRALGLRTE